VADCVRHLQHAMAYLAVNVPRLAPLSTNQIVHARHLLACQTTA
jgi:hypothetical protein